MKSQLPCILPLVCIFWLAGLLVNWICYLEFWLRPTDWCLFERALWFPSISTPINYQRFDRSENDQVSVHFSGRGALGIFDFATLHWIIRISFILLLFAEDLVNIFLFTFFPLIASLIFLHWLVCRNTEYRIMVSFVLLVISSEPV